MRAHASVLSKVVQFNRGHRYLTPIGFGRFGPVVAGTLGAGFAVFAISLVAGSGRYPAWVDLIFQPVGVVLLALGLFVWLRQPDVARIGLLLCAVGVTWYLGDLQYSAEPVMFRLGVWLCFVHSVILAHVILAAPDGVLRSRSERITLLACYAAVLITQGLRVLTEDPLQPQGWGDPRGEISIWAPIGSAAAIVGVGAVIVLIIRRWRAESLALRRARGWYWPAVVLVGVDAAAQGVGGLLRVAPAVAGVLLGGYALAVVFLGMTIAANAIRLQLGHRHISLLVAQMQAGSDQNGWLRDAIARSLADPTLTLHYRRDDSEDYVDCAGNAAPLPVADPNRAMTRVGPEHAPVAVLVHDPFLARHPRQREKLRAVAAAAGLAIRNGRSMHEDSARMSIMEMRARRKIGADLHDGPQYRLTALKLMIGQARATASAENQDLLRRIDGMVQEAVRDLREVAQGVYPSTLRAHGLARALDDLAGSSPVPVVIDDEGAAEPLSERVAETAYFLVSEAVGNAVRHAGADLITIRLRTREGTLVATVADNGSGRARMSPAGGGVRGMHDRAVALDGSFDMQSEPGKGTTVTVRLPCV